MSKTMRARRRFSASKLLPNIGAIALGLLVNSGQIKYLGWFPVDMTLASVALVAGCSAVAFVLSPRLDRTMLWPLGLWAIFVFPWFAVSNNLYGDQKAVSLFAITLVGALGPFFLLRSEGQRRAFLGTLVVTAVAFCWVAYSNGLLEYDPTIAPVLDQMNPLSLARAIVPGVIVMALYGLTRGRSLLFRWGWLALAAISLTMVFASGRRGPIVSVAISVFLCLLIAPAFKKYRGRTLLLAFLATVASAWAVARTDTYGGERVLTFFAGEEDASSNARLFIWDKALELVASHPAGIGWGQFPQYAALGQMTTDSGRMYPHNILLEVLVEAGWLAGIAVTIYFIVALVRGVRAAATPTATVMLALLVSGLVNATVSGDLNDQKLLWVTLTVALMSKTSATRRQATSRPIPTQPLWQSP